MRFLASIAFLALLQVNGIALGQDNDPVAGLALARHICADCHLVAGPNPKSLQRGPSFTELKNRPGISAVYLQDFLKKPHGEMPRVPLTANEINDLISYILMVDN